MRSYTYPCTLTEIAADDVQVGFTEFPEVVTGGPDRSRALAEAPDALAAVVEVYLAQGRELPSPRGAGENEMEVALDPALAARAVLLSAMREQALSKVALAQRMGRDEKVARRIVSGSGASLELTLEALRAVGVRAGLAVPEPLAPPA